MHDGIQREILIVMQAFDGLNKIPVTEKPLWNSNVVQKHYEVMVKQIVELGEQVLLE